MFLSSVYINIWLTVFPCPRPDVLPHCVRPQASLRLPVAPGHQGITHVELLRCLLMSRSISYEPYKFLHASLGIQFYVPYGFMCFVMKSDPRQVMSGSLPGDVLSEDFWTSPNQVMSWPRVWSEDSWRCLGDSLVVEEIEREVLYRGEVVVPIEDVVPNAYDDWVTRG